MQRRLLGKYGADNLFLFFFLSPASSKENRKIRLRQCGDQLFRAEYCDIEVCELIGATFYVPNKMHTSDAILAVGAVSTQNFAIAR